MSGFDTWSFAISLNILINTRSIFQNMTKSYLVCFDSKHSINIHWKLQQNLSNFCVSTATRVQLGNGLTSKFVHNILVYLCAKIGAFIKKFTALIKKKKKSYTPLSSLSCVCVRACVYIYIYICVCVYMYINTHTHTYTYTYLRKTPVWPTKVSWYNNFEGRNGFEIKAPLPLHRAPQQYLIILLDFVGFCHLVGIPHQNAASSYNSLLYHITAMNLN